MSHETVELLSPEEALISAVLRLRLRDLRSTCAHRRQQAEAWWLQSGPWFASWTGCTVEELQEQFRRYEEA